MFGEHRDVEAGAVGGRDLHLFGGRDVPITLLVAPLHVRDANHDPDDAPHRPSILRFHFGHQDDTAKGNRPSFSEAARPETAEPLYEAFCAELASLGVPVATGVFGASMQVELVNDGPVTIVLET